MKKGNAFWQLFFTFFRIGAFTFGGGYAMIPLIQREAVENRHWVSQSDILDVVAIAESTPGPIAINAATYIGYKNAGILGALVSTVGMVLPSFTIIYVITLFFDAFLSLTYVAYAFRGIQACVVWLILSAGLKMAKGLKRTPLNTLLFTASILVMLLTSLFAVRFSTVLLILLCGCIGLAVYLITLIRNRKENGK